MSEEAGAGKVLSLEARGADEISRFVAIAGLGMCRAVAAGAVTPAYACQRLFGPALLARLAQLDACVELQEAIHLATELEDVADILPGGLASAVADVEARLLNVLGGLAAQDDVGDRWLLAKSSSRG